jgi:Asp-tRNA(Asn)/Glu-tRNA(Gln) amidotransferase C subunit
MLKFTEKLHEDLVSKLQMLEDDPHSEKFRAEQRIGLIIKTINQILKKLETHRFPTEKEEIDFFKSVLPSTISLLVYYDGKNDWESVERLATLKAKQDYLEQLFRKINDFFKDNDELFRYYRSGKTNLDRYFFLPKRNPYDEDYDLLSALMDPSFCTISCLKVAIFLGYARLEKDILDALNKKEDGVKLRKKVWGESNMTESFEKLEWTFSKVALTELIYALKATGVFNNGKADLKTIVRYFEKVFAVDLGNISRTHQEVINRKTGQTIFLDELKEKMAELIERSLKHN